MNKFNKDAEFNKIGQCWLMWNLDHKKFYDLVDKLYDDELYLMYDMRTYLMKRLSKINDTMYKDDIKEDFIKFSRELVKEIETMIYSKEIREKYDS